MNGIETENVTVYVKKEGADKAFVVPANTTVGQLRLISESNGSGQLKGSGGYRPQNDHDVVVSRGVYSYVKAGNAAA